MDSANTQLILKKSENISGHKHSTAEKMHV